MTILVALRGQCIETVVGWLTVQSDGRLFMETSYWKGRVALRIGLKWNKPEREDYAYLSAIRGKEWNRLAPKVPLLTWGSGL